MKILYVAKFGEHDNQDENAIAWALEQLGHEVTRVPEVGAEHYFRDVGNIPKHHFLLFHKWEKTILINRIVTIPKVCWYFDLVQSDDFTEGAGVGRVEWCNAIEPGCLLMCHTDGDWAALNPTRRVHLCQGMDERVAGFGTPYANNDVPPILFVGGVRYSKKRTTLMQELKERYGDKFQVRGEHARTRLHGRQLADLYASTKILIAPDNATDGWWSNRVWNTLGLGGFLIHPFCQWLAESFLENELVLYKDRQDLFDLIDHYLCWPNRRADCAIRGNHQVMTHHTYRHRCERLIELVRERLNLPKLITNPHESMCGAMGLDDVRPEPR